MRSVVRGLGVVVSGGLLLLAGACGDDDPTGGGGGGGGTGGTITVTVTSGTAPAYSWTGGDVFTVSVTRTADPTVIVWGVVTPGGDGIASAVTHGMVPSGTVQVSMPPALEMTLTAGVDYTVNVVRENPVGFGFIQFTP